MIVSGNHSTNSIKPTPSGVCSPWSSVSPRGSPHPPLSNLTFISIVPSPYPELSDSVKIHPSPCIIPNTWDWHDWYHSYIVPPDLSNPNFSSYNFESANAGTTILIDEISSIHEIMNWKPCSNFQSNEAIQSPYSSPLSQSSISPSPRLSWLFYLPIP